MSAHLRFRHPKLRATFQNGRVLGERIELLFTVTGKTTEAAVVATIHDGRLVGEVRWGGAPATPLTGRRPVVPTLESRAAEHSMPRGKFAKIEGEGAPVASLVEHGTTERSSALVLVEDGKIVLETYRPGYDGGPVLAMSGAKSIASLAVGMLVADKKLSLDTPIATFFPEWSSQDAKKAITVRHLLTHTSGLDPSRARWARESIRAHAAKAEVVTPPGTRFRYNNAAVDLLAAVFAKAAGMGLDAYLEARLFRKLDVVGASWMLDKDGVPRAGGELSIRPVDLAKIGQLMLDGGRWRGEQLVPADWVEQVVATQQHFDESCGFLWWREGTFSFVLTQSVLDGWRDAAIDPAIIESARPLLGTKHADRFLLLDALRETLGAETFATVDARAASAERLPLSNRVADGPSTGFSARGSLGQYLVVLPKSRLVAVRMRAFEASDAKRDDADDRDAYPEFAADVARLIP